MIAAIYARKSTEQNGVADGEKSIDRQVEHARIFASERGWTIAEDHIYVDDGISGAEFANRPGLVRLLNSVDTKRRRPPFQVLVISDFDRLGRESVETPYVLKQIISAGVRVFSYLDRNEITLDSPIATLMMQVQAFGAALEREKARQRTYDAMLRKAKAGHVTGGACFGYDNVDVMTDQLDKSGRPIRSHVTRRINEAEAAIVRRIFELSARGVGQLTIAKELNDQGAPSPKSQRGRPSGWAQSSVHQILFRELYRGEVVWNKTRKRDQWGKKKPSDRDSSEWIRVPVPELRIVPDALWTAAHRRLEESRAVYLRGTDGKLWGRPINGSDAKYLLSGFFACAKCGGNLDVRSRSHGSRRAFFYCCSTYLRRGKAICPHELLCPMPTADRAVIEWVQRELLDPEFLEAAFARALERRLKSGQSLEPLREKLRAEIRKAEDGIERLTDAIAAGGDDIPALLAGLRARQRKRDELTRDLRQVDSQANSRSPVPVNDLKRQFKDGVSDWQAFLHQGVPQARQLLRKLVRGRITVELDQREGRPGFTLRATGSFDKLFAQLLPEGFSQALASPTGFDRSHGCHSPGNPAFEKELVTWMAA